MSSGIRRMYAVLCGVAVLLILAAIISGNRKQNSPNLLHMKPDGVFVENERTKSFYFDVESKRLGGQGIAFFTNHQEVVVYCNSARLYELRKTDGIWGHTTGSVWNFVHLPYNTKEVHIRLEQAYESYEMDDFYIIAGNDREIYCSILENSALAMVCSTIIIIIGIGLMIVWGVARKRTESVSNVFYLGILSLVFGLWAFNETDGAAIIWGDRVASSFAAFILLKLMAPTLVLFMREFTREKRDTVWEIFSRIIILESLITISMHMFNIMDLKETVITTHLILVVASIYAIVLVAIALRNKTIVGNAKIYFVAGILVAIAAVAGFLNYYVGGNGEDVIGRVGFLVFAILAASQTADYALKMMEKGKYAAIYEELAITDSLTGLYNRNAYQIDTKKMVELTGYMICTFDLNDLKVCNDTWGHAEGDQYIITSAKMIERLWAPFGRCYRIGGDEFCAIIRNGKNCPIEELLMKLEMEQIRYNANLTLDRCPIRIAVGYAIYDSDMDDDIETMRSRADSNMYQNKRQQKESYQ